MPRTSTAAVAPEPVGSGTGLRIATIVFAALAGVGLVAQFVFLATV